MKAAQNEKGMVLLLVLVIVALLASLVTEFAFSTLVDLRLTETFRDRTRAWYLAKGGIQAGRMILQEDQNGFDHLGEMWAAGIPAYPVGEEGTVSVAIEDLSARINVNKLLDSFQTLDSDTASRLYRLFDKLGIPEPEAADLTAALTDWIDSDSQPRTAFTLDNGKTIRAEGAEDSHYERLERPYKSKGNPLDTLDELALVKGFTPGVLRQVLPYLTIFGDKKINLNTASAPVLKAMDEAIDDQAAEEIVARRENTPFKNTQEVTTISGLQTMLHAKFSVKGQFFQIDAEGVVNDGVRRATAVVEKVVKNGKLQTTVHYMKVD